MSRDPGGPRVTRHWGRRPADRLPKRVLFRDEGAALEAVYPSAYHECAASPGACTAANVIAPGSHMVVVTWLERGRRVGGRWVPERATYHEGCTPDTLLRAERMLSWG